MFELLEQWTAENYGAAVATLATLVGLLTAAVGNVFASRSQKEAAEVQNDVSLLVTEKGEGVDLSEFDFETHARLGELRRLQERFQSQSRRNSLSHNSLVFGQYIVGALLASSFIQQTLDGQLIGLLGVLVLLSSAIQQRFRPDVLAAQARLRAVYASQMIRKIENGVFQVQAKSPKAPNLLKLREQATVGLDSLEAEEVAGLEAYHRARALEQELSD